MLGLLESHGDTMKSLSFILLGIFLIPIIDSFASDRQNCRGSKDQEFIISCIEKKIYDPCDDAGGKWGASQCGWAHAEIANRKIKKYESEIKEKIKQSKNHDKVLSLFENSTLAWEEYKKSHCDFTNTADDLDNFSSIHLHMAFCIRRLNEQRVIELNNVLSRSY
jgi:hypothetical protein